jgi:hypothetical protein
LTSDSSEFGHLDDPAFLDARARLRERLEHVPENAVDRPELERVREAMTEEFCRRARIAWSQWLVDNDAGKPQLERDVALEVRDKPPC